MVAYSNTLTYAPVECSQRQCTSPDLRHVIWEMRTREQGDGRRAEHQKAHCQDAIYLLHIGLVDLKRPLMCTVPLDHKLADTLCLQERANVVDVEANPRAAQHYAPLVVDIFHKLGGQVKHRGLA